MHWFRNGSKVFGILVAVLIGVVQLSTPAYAQVQPSSPAQQATIDQLVEISKQLQVPGLRGQHSKAHGTVRAEFTVLPDLPKDLQIGVFREPGKTFPAWIRFSNGRAMNDTEKGVHGVGIKLMGVEGDKVLDAERDAQTQDFVLIDHPVFFSRNAEEFLGFFQEQIKPTGKPALSPQGLSIAREFRQKQISNPLAVQYWSTTPYQLGSEVIKFSIKPTSQISGSIGDDPNYLRSAMVSYLNDHDATFDFLIQRQTDTAKMPIDDPTIEWSEDDSPFQKVATIRIPRQVFDTPEQNTFGENLSFTPWHSLPEHQPLGSINLARKAIYQALSGERHRETGMVHQEPTAETTPT